MEAIQSLRPAGFTPAFGTVGSTHRKGAMNGAPGGGVRCSVSGLRVNIKEEFGSSIPAL